MRQSRQYEDDERINHRENERGNCSNHCTEGKAVAVLEQRPDGQSESNQTVGTKAKERQRQRHRATNGNAVELEMDEERQRDDQTDD